jgi:hypothetical protein
MPLSAAFHVRVLAATSVRLNRVDLALVDPLRSTTINGHQTTGSAGPFCAKIGSGGCFVVVRILSL